MAEKVIRAELPKICEKIDVKLGRGERRILIGEEGIGIVKVFDVAYPLIEEAYTEKGWKITAKPVVKRGPIAVLVFEEAP